MGDTKGEIHFVMMGGTIDSFFDGTKDTVVPLKKSIIPDYIASMRVDFKTKFTEVAMKDSRDLKEEDLKKMLEVVEESPLKRVVITHGTYTLHKSAAYLKSRLERKDQTIVFTGSLIPLIGNVFSDAPFNLGYSIAKAQELPAGIFVGFNGSIFPPEEALQQIYKRKAAPAHPEELFKE